MPQLVSCRSGFGAGRRVTLVKPQARVLRSVPEPEVMGGVCPGSAPQMPPALSVLAGVWPPLLPSHLCVGGPLPSSQSASRFSSARCVCCLAGAPGSLLPGSHPWPPMASCYQLGVDLKGGPQCRSGDLGPGGGFCPMSQRLGASAPICASGPSPDARAEGPPTSVGAAWIPNALQKT